MISKGWNPALHPRWPKGNGDRAGEFRSLRHLAAELVDNTLTNEGATFHHTRGYPTSGFPVARPGSSRIIKKQRFMSAGAQALYDYIKQHSADFEKDPELHLGTWYDKQNNEIVLDLVDVIPDEASARRIGKERGEQAIFNLATFEEIPIGGTGGRENYEIEKAARRRRALAKAAVAAHGGGTPGMVRGTVLEGAARRREVAKRFNPLQRRDWHGRWSREAPAEWGGGGGQKGGKSKPGKVRLQGTKATGRTTNQDKIRSTGQGRGGRVSPVMGPRVTADEMRGETRPIQASSDSEFLIGEKFETERRGVVHRYEVVHIFPDGRRGVEVVTGTYDFKGGKRVFRQQKVSQAGFTREALANLAKLQNVQKKWNRNQPRWPKGSGDRSGEWRGVGANLGMKGKDRFITVPKMTPDISRARPSDVVDLRSNDPDALRMTDDQKAEIRGVVERVYNRFPDLPGPMQVMILADDDWRMEDAWAATATSKKLGHPIYLNMNLWDRRKVAEGIAIWKEDKGAIAGQANSVQEFRRMTLLHEIGHYIQLTNEDQNGIDRDNLLPQPVGPVDDLAAEMVRPSELGYAGRYMPPVAARWQVDALGFRSGYSISSPFEWFAEAFLDGYWNAGEASPSGRRAYQLTKKLYGGEGR